MKTAVRSELPAGQAGMEVYLLAALSSACGDHVLSDEQVRHAVGGVARYYRDHVGERVVAGPYPRLLLARALWGIGCRAHADSILDQALPPGRQRENWGRFILSDARLPTALWTLVLHGVVRAAAWTGSHGNDWFLDGQRLLVDPSENCELIVARGMRHVAEILLPLWDASAGQGSLTLGHMPPSAGERLPVALGMTSLRAFFEEVFRRESEKRQWRSAPAVLDADLRAG